jgi:hypothetical protein
VSEALRFEIGSEVRFPDGSVCGRLNALVVDPVGRLVTHLVVEPRSGPVGSRLVPVELAAEGDGAVEVSCDSAGFEQLEEAEETRFIPTDGDEWGLAADHVLSWPYFGLGGAGIGWMGVGALGAGAGAVGPQPIVYDRVPAGEVEVRRGEPVHATDGAIGHVRGLVVDDARHVTHVLLDEGHLWGHKQVAIPISAVTDVLGGVHLSLSKDEVRELPAVELS